MKKMVVWIGGPNGAAVPLQLHIACHSCLNYSYETSQSFVGMLEASCARDSRAINITKKQLIIGTTKTTLNLGTKSVL